MSSVPGMLTLIRAGTHIFHSPELDFLPDNVRFCYAEQVALIVATFKERNTRWFMVLVDNNVAWVPAFNLNTLSSKAKVVNRRQAK